MPNLITKLSDAKAIVADKGYGSECIREQMMKGAKAVMPKERNSQKGDAGIDWDLYYRNLMESAFA